MHRLLGYGPIFISLCWVVFILAAQAGYCRPPRTDEGPAAHLFQLMMVAQIPASIGFLLTKGSRPFTRILPVLALQLLGWIAAAMTAKVLT
ncbi:MAG: hypothetical protein M3Z37_04405 [Candidatus Eremiobacteraeota bacterium]|nr:hypothetical protein [Candidatus Eremiobacteraeota bacterium]